jgi:hypothetical protein
LLLVVLAVSVQAQQADRNADNSQASEQTIAKLQAAAVRYETIELLIQQNKFGSIIPELKKIFDLNLPKEFEKYQLQAVVNLATELGKKNQFVVGHNVIDLALENAETDESKFNLYTMKTVLFRNAGQTREAFETLELANKYRKPETKDRRK